MVLALRAELGTTQGTVKRVAEQLGIGTESVSYTHLTLPTICSV